MVGRVVWVTLLILLAGCSEDAADDERLQSMGDGVEDESDNATAELGPPAVLAFQVSISGNLTEAENGTFLVPAHTNVTFDANASEGANLTFAWSFGNVTAQGPVATFAFDVGNHTVTVVMTDAAGGENRTVINVTAFETTPPEPVLVSSTPIKFSHAAQTEANGCFNEDHDLAFPADTTTRFVRMELDPAWTGVAVDISYKLILFDASGAEVAKATRTGGSNNLVLEEDDLALPAGDYTARAEICGTLLPQTSFTVDGRADHFA